MKQSLVLLSLLVLPCFSVSAQTQLPTFDRAGPVQQTRYAAVRMADKEPLMLLDAQETTLSALVVDEEDRDQADLPRLYAAGPAARKGEERHFGGGTEKQASAFPARPRAGVF